MPRRKLIAVFEILGQAATGAALGEVAGFFAAHFIPHYHISDDVLIHLCALVGAVALAILALFSGREKRSFVTLADCLSESDRLLLLYRLTKSQFKNIRKKCFKDAGIEA